MLIEFENAEYYDADQENKIGYGDQVYTTAQNAYPQVRCIVQYAFLYQLFEFCALHPAYDGAIDQDQDHYADLDPHP